MNKLHNELSPYLLQHKYDPVNWFPWGEEAINKAREEDKLIFLSSGYNACHWCHVMQRECFQNDEIAQMMNLHFVSIKLDREERPDLDSIYMNYVQTLTGTGGWPLNVFLTPDLIPIYGGTYFPPVRKFGRISFPELLSKVFEAYELKKTEIKKNYSSVIDLLEGEVYVNESTKILNHFDFDKAAALLFRERDAKHGGFGYSPKFPHASTLLFLMRYYHFTKNELAEQTIRQSLDNMMNNGLYDNLEGGFHRYSTTTDWLVPHFEKMLYDNAMIPRAYLEAYKVFKEHKYLDVALETLDFVLAKMQSNEGVFYSSLCADSDGKEGKYYLWNYEQIASVLNAEEMELAKKIFRISEKGNYEKFNILTRTNDYYYYSENNYDELYEIITKLRNSKVLRTPPSIDDKTIISWNAMLATTFSLAYSTTMDEKYLEFAKKIINIVLKKCKIEDELYHIYKKGQIKIQGFLEDYAYVIEALISLYEVTFEQSYIIEAKKLCETALLKFYDYDKGMFFFSDEGSENLIIRPTNCNDNNMPSSNSVMIQNLIVLSYYFYQPMYLDIVHKVINNLQEKAITQPLNYSAFLSAAYLTVAGNKEFTVVYNSKNTDIQDLLQKIHQNFNPFIIKSAIASDSERFLPILEDKEAHDGRTTYYICENNYCHDPIYNEKEFLEYLYS